jgi:hypothetical protein
VTIQDLGSIGELVAAIATIATLAYLAIQIRQLSNATRADAARGTSDGDAVILALAQDAELNRIFVTGLGDYSALDTFERTRFTWAMGSVIGPAARNYEHVVLGIYSEENFINHCRGQLMQLTTPGGKEFWRLYSHTFPPKFRDFVTREFSVSTANDSDDGSPVA